MFSDAISSISWRCRPSSPLMAAAISGSASASVALKNESGADPAELALEDEVVMEEISPPPQPVRQGAAGHVWRSKEAPARYHIARNWPSACGRRLIFVQDMVGMARIARRPGSDPSSPRP